MADEKKKADTFATILTPEQFAEVLGRGGRRPDAPQSGTTQIEAIVKGNYIMLEFSVGHMVGITLKFPKDDLPYVLHTIKEIIKMMQIGEPEPPTSAENHSGDVMFG